MDSPRGKEINIERARSIAESCQDVSTYDGHYTAEHIKRALSFLVSEYDRLSTPPPRTYEQGAEECEWRPGIAGAWVSSCGRGAIKHSLDLQFKYCPTCGKSIVIRALPTQPEGEGE